MGNDREDPLTRAETSKKAEEASDAPRNPVRASRCWPSSAGAEIEREHFRRAGGLSVRLDAKQVTAGFEARGVGIAVNVPVRAQSETRRGADGLRSPSLILSNERHPVAGSRQVRRRRRAKLDHAAGRQVKVRYRTATHCDKCEVRRDRRPNSRRARIEGRRQNR